MGKATDVMEISSEARNLFRVTWRRIVIPHREAEGTLHHWSDEHNHQVKLFITIWNEAEGTLHRRSDEHNHQVKLFITIWNEAEGTLHHRS